MAAIAVMIVFTELIWGGYSIVSTYFKSNFDRSTTGEIIVSEWFMRKHVTRVGSRETPVYNVQYVYSVEGQSYRGRLVNFDHTSENVSQILKRYPKGKKVRVFYDSENPELCVLEVTTLSWDIIATYISIFLLVPVVTWLGTRYSG